jgi:hypothetical protein
MGSPLFEPAVEPRPRTLAGQLLRVALAFTAVAVIVPLFLALPRAAGVQRVEYPTRSVEPPPTSPPRVATAPDRSCPRLVVDVMASIVRLDASTYRLSRAATEILRANPSLFARGARIIPAVADGKPTGLKLYAIKPCSIFRALGIDNGDTIVSVNGFDFTTLDRALELYQEIKAAHRVWVDIVRRGQPPTFEYRVESVRR